MPYIQTTDLKKKTNKRQVVAIACLVCFIVAFLLLEAFILTYANHTHDHDGLDGTCATCAQLQNAENLFKQLGAVASGASCILAGLFAACTMLKPVSSKIALLTPITLKIRMNN